MIKSYKKLTNNFVFKQFTKKSFLIVWNLKIWWVFIAYYVEYRNQIDKLIICNKYKNKMSFNIKQQNEEFNVSNKILIFFFLILIELY